MYLILFILDKTTSQLANICAYTYLFRQKIAIKKVTSLISRVVKLREAIKKTSFFWTLSKRGGGVQPESKSFEVVLFSPILTLLWTLNGEGVG